ncbi:MAG: hypothetical protein ACFCVD_19015 [Nodosilinea sp.]
MYVSAVDHLLFYKISTEPDGVKLRIWESPATSTESSATYLYIINCRVRSIAEAKARLQSHLALNGGTLAMGEALPNKGKVRLMPFPTWNGTEE